MQVSVRTIDEIKDDIRAEVNDSGSSRWASDAQVYRGMNEALRKWGDKCAVPMLYTITGGFVSGTYDYTLPDYVDGPIRVEHKRPVGLDYDSGDDTSRIWETVTAYDVVPNSTGGRVLRLHYSPESVDAQIIFYAKQGPIPVAATAPTLNADMTTSSTTLTIGSKPVVARAGYVKIDNEWMSYAGVTEGASSLTLNNLVRGLFSTTAATHDGTGTPASVKWGVGTHNIRLYNHMNYMTCAYLHKLYLNKAIADQRDHHMDQMRYYMQVAMEEWRAIPQAKPVQFKLSRAAIGGQIDEYSLMYVPEGS